MSGDIRLAIINHKRAAEKYFAATSFGTPETARVECGFLSHTDITDTAIAQYWKGITEGQDPVNAAIHAGLFTEITGWLTDIPTGGWHPDQYAREIMRDAYVLRIADEQTQLAQATASLDVERMQAIISNMAADRAQTGKDISTAVDVALGFTERLYDPSAIAIPSGIPLLDRAMGGLEYQKETVLAARPSMGKSTLAFQIARQVARQGHRAMVFSLEMKRYQLWEKAVFGVCELDRRKMINGTLTEDEKVRLTDASTSLMNLYTDNLLIDDTTRQTLQTIWERCARMKPALVVVDRLDLVYHPEVNKIDRLGYLTMGLRQMAQELNFHVLVIHQLNRDVEKRDNKEPVMSDLRDSGNIEQDADNVLFIHRADYYDQMDVPPPVSNTDIIIAKFRDGVRNIKVNLKYKLAAQWFYGRDEL